MWASRLPPFFTAALPLETTLLLTQALQLQMEANRENIKLARPARGVRRIICWTQTKGFSLNRIDRLHKINCRWIEDGGKVPEEDG